MKKIVKMGTGGLPPGSPERGGGVSRGMPRRGGMPTKGNMPPGIDPRRVLPGRPMPGRPMPQVQQPAGGGLRGMTAGLPQDQQIVDRSMGPPGTALKPMPVGGLPPKQTTVTLGPQQGMTQSQLRNAAPTQSQMQMLQGARSGLPQQPGSGSAPMGGLAGMAGRPMKKGGKVSSASKRADGCAVRGKTRA